VIQSNLENWTDEEDKLLRELIRKRLSVKREDQTSGDLKFVADMLNGEDSERNLLSIINGNVEVKTHSKAGEYGAVFIETMQGCNQTGINTSKADWQAQVLDGEEFNSEVIVLINTKRLKSIVSRHFHIKGGECSRGAKVKLKDLLMTNTQINKLKEIS